MERSVQVWQITDPVGDPLPQRFPSAGLHRLITAAQSTGQDLYHLGYDGVWTLMEPLPGRRPHLALHTIRHDNLPSEDAAGTIVDLSIGAGHGLAEGTHFLFCPRNIVICLYNHHGPRIRRLGDWLQARTGLEVGFVPLYRRDAWAVVESMTRLTGVEISIPASQARALEPSPGLDDTEGLLDTLRAAGRTAGGGQVHLSWTVGRGDDRMPQSRLRSVAGILFRMSKGGMDVARIKGRVPGAKDPVPVDLLHDQLVTRRSVEAERGRTRRLNATSAYEAMDSTYEQFREQITEAVDEVPEDRLPLPVGLTARPADQGRPGSEDG